MTRNDIPEYPFLVGGKWRKNPDPFPVRSPCSGEPVGLVHRAGKSDLDDAVQAAAASFAITRTMTTGERSRLLASLSDRIEENARDLTRTIILEAGKARKTAETEALRAVQTIRTSAEEAKRIGGEVIDMDWTDDGKGRTGIIRRFPVGPVLGIVPFNFPLNLACHKLGPAFAAGNPVILKPSTATPISALLLGRMAVEAGFPDGTVSVLPCPGNEAERMVADPRIAAVSFTGSADVGWHLRDIARKKKVCLELGGNAAVILAEDCQDLDYATSRIVIGGYSNAGQVCSSVQRVLIHRDVYETALDMILSKVARLRSGDPDNLDTDVGPLISENAAKKAEHLIRESESRGAKVLCGGVRSGNFISPAVITGTTPGMRIEDQEAFAPLITVNSYTDFGEALERACSGEYGLQIGVFSSDISRILKAFDDASYGGVIINDIPSFRVDQMPYGGVRSSGQGREGPRYAIRELTEERLLVINPLGGRK